jgi:hypothetical protein
VRVLSIRTRVRSSSRFAAGPGAAGPTAVAAVAIGDAERGRRRGRESLPLAGAALADTHGAPEDAAVGSPACEETGCVAGASVVTERRTESMGAAVDCESARTTAVSVCADVQWTPPAAARRIMAMIRSERPTMSEIPLLFFTDCDQSSKPRFRQWPKLAI